MFLPASSEPDLGDNGLNYANFTSTQGFGQFSHSAGSSDLSQNWATPNLQLYNQNFNFHQMRPSQPFSFPGQESTDFNFHNMMQPQRVNRKAQLDPLAIPGLERLRTPSVQADPHGPRNSATNDGTYASFVMSPTNSVMNVPQHATSTENDFADQQHFTEFK